MAELSSGIKQGCYTDAEENIRAADRKGSVFADMCRSDCIRREAAVWSRCGTNWIICVFGPPQRTGRQLKLLFSSLNNTTSVHQR